MDYDNPQIAEIYDIANPPGADTDFYVYLAGPHSRSILDLSCGTGTLSEWSARGFAGNQ